MYDIDNFDRGYNMGVRHVIEQIESVLYYIPEEWKKKEARTIVNIVQNRIRDCKRLYITED